MYPVICNPVTVERLLYYIESSLPVTIQHKYREGAPTYCVF
jgi:hypothetical protein